MSWYKRPIITATSYKQIPYKSGERILLALNWYKRHIVASGGLSATVTNVNGVQSVRLNGNTYPFKQQINQLGFRYQWPVKDNTGKVIENGFWWAALDTVRNSPQIIDGLRQLGIQVDHFLQQQQRAPANQPMQQTPQPQNPVNVAQPRTYYLSVMLKNNLPVAVSKSQSGWDWVNEQGQKGSFPAADIQQIVKSVRNERNLPYSSNNPSELFEIFKQINSEVTDQDLEATPDPNEVPGEGQEANPQLVDDASRKAGMIPDAKMSAEQKAIDQDFATGQSSLMIDALAGSGKTTMLKHLAWKYGNPNQNWLYMVFNTKNKVEAKQKFPTSWVKVATTNSFLGNILSHAAKRGLIPTTERMKNLEPKGKKLKKAEQVPQKTELFVDGPQFVQMSRQFGILPQAGWENKLSFMQSFEKERVKGLLQSIRNEFGKACIQLTSLSKAFAVDPRKQNFRKQIEDVLSKYDVDHDMLDLKERINKYREPLRSSCVHGLAAVLGYDFMTRSYRNECLTAVEWMLKECLPGASKQMFNYGGKSHNLGQYRDFDDDLWFTAINADKMDWSMGQPKGFSHVLADEVQDFNECQKIALGHMKRLGSKVVAVGDPNQSLYRFRGADAAAFGNIANILGSKKHALSYNFRSRPAVIAYSNANTHVKNLKSGLKVDLDELSEYLSNPPLRQDPEDIEWEKKAAAMVGAGLTPSQIKQMIDAGQLEWPPYLNGKATYQKKEYENVFQELAAERQAGKNVGSSFISRTNAPLANAALQCLAQGLPFVIVGKDIAGDLIEHINTLAFARMKNGPGPLNDNSPLSELAGKLHEYLDDQVRQHGNKASKRGFLQDLSDTTVALEAAIQQFDVNASAPPTANEDDNYADIDAAPSPTGNAAQNAAVAGSTVGGFKKWLNEKLGGLDLDQNEGDVLKYMEEVEKNKKNAPIVLTTAHKSKGLEWERCYILRDDQFPHPKAQRPEDLQQEANAKYVCYTRAMRELHIVKLEGQPGYQKK